MATTAWQRQLITVFTVFLIPLLGCGCKRAASPDATYLQIREEARRGKLDAAIHDADAAYAKYQSTNPEWAWRFRVQKAHMLVFRGSFAESLQLLKEEVPTSLAHSEVAVRRRMVQGLDYTYMQRMDEADTELAAAEAMASGFGPDVRGDLLQARGNLEVGRKRYDQAADAFREALSIARKGNLPFLEVNAVGNLGNVAMWEEHYDEAIDWYKLALQKAQATGTVSSAALALGNIGWNYTEVGDLASAGTVLKQAEQESERDGLLGNRVYWLSVLGDVYYRQGRFADAEEISHQALSLASSRDDKAAVTNCLNILSEIALATGRLDKAEKYNQEALTIERAGLDRFGIASSTIIAGRIAARKKQYREAEKAFQKVIRDPSVETPQRWEAQAGLAQVHAAMGHAALAEREFSESVNTISKARNELQREEFRLSFLSTAIRFYDAYVNFLVGQKRSLDALKVADLSRAQTLEHGLSSGSGEKSTSPEQIHPQEIARRWNATLLFYWLGEERSHLWVITPARVSWLPLPGRAEIDGRVQSYLAAFPSPSDPLETGNADGKKLYEMLIGPAEKLIPKNSRVIILPDSDLNSLNFETLIVTGDRPHYWIEDVTLFTGNSLALLSRSSPTAPPGDASLFLMGDALQASPDFPALPQAGKEVGLVQSYFPAGRRSVLTGAQATPSRFLSGKPEEFSYLHFATHGTASTIRPLESAVILSPEGDAYKLYARDVVQHPVHAYLVTISACNGAGMKTYAGEGLVGLAWAFLRAGAHNVIGGLWEVSNASTPQLMDELYKGLNEGKDPATALRNAKLTLVHSTGNYRRPFYWGPFQLYAGS
ncbi:MAG: hypothetical protein DMG37_01725 [Acidobacteria bacterium]|nr:MAG: hypothetical protein DMG37_01725 [Acidobacteriota bacterium]